MPRIPHSLLHHASSISPLLPLVLRGARTLDSAIHELRWLREHVQERRSKHPGCRSSEEEALRILCQRRARGEPLQYILGSQPFGGLDIKCRPEVLIPRPETEAYTTHLAQLLNNGLLNVQPDKERLTEVWDLPKRGATLKILDLCSGTGCISLLLHSLLSKTFPVLQIMGWDISEAAIALSRENLDRNLKKGFLKSTASSVAFHRVDLFSEFTKIQKQQLECDIIISNPPYISAESFDKETARSVRNWEPILALVPQIPCSGSCLPEDVFYERLISLHLNVSKSKIILMEAGDDVQVLRVVRMVLGMISNRSENHSVEIWRDWPEQPSNADEAQEMTIDGKTVPVKGSGKLRAIVLSLGIYIPEQSCLTSFNVG